MNVVILAGGFGSRMAGETEDKPKAMVEIGGRPILWHIMMHFDHHGFRDFVIALGYMGEVIRERVQSSGLFAGPSHGRASDGESTTSGGNSCRWTVQLVETGLHTQNAGRIKRLAPYLGNRTFMLTWCDGLSDVDLQALLAFHRSHGRLATVTAVHPPSRFGHLELRGDQVVHFSEKAVIKDRWINGAFFVLEPGVLDYIEHDDTHWEMETLERLTRDGQLMAYRHQSFWQCMDTMHERRLLEELWRQGSAPWKTWS